MPTEGKGSQPGLIVFIYPKVHRFNLTEMVEMKCLTNTKSLTDVVNPGRAIGYDNPLLPSFADYHECDNTAAFRSAADGIVSSDLIRVDFP